MKNILGIVFLSALCSIKLFGHSGKDFYDQCDKIELPQCNQVWNALTNTENAVYLVGDTGNCYIYYHEGNMLSVNTGTVNDLSGVSFINNNIGYTWGDNGTLLKTTNAGRDWSIIATDTTSTIDKVQFIDENNGYFIVDTIISKTENGGTSWTQVNLPANIAFKDFYFFDTNKGQICGNSSSLSYTGYLYETNNGGDSWTELYTDTCSFSKLFYPDNDTGYVYGNTTNTPLLLKTINQGVAWTIKYTSNQWSLLSDVVKYQNQTYFISEETTGDYLFGSSLFLNAIDGKIPFIANIISTPVFGIETMYILSEGGLYRYVSGAIRCPFINFGNSIDGFDPNPNNPYNIIEAGEKIRIRSSAYNLSDSNIPNLNCKLRCHSPYVTVTDSLTSFGSIDGYLSGTTLDEFEISLHSDIPTNYVLHLEMQYSNNSINTSSVIDLPIISSPFTLHSITIVDTAHAATEGNNNGIVEPNETILITPNINNTTSFDFKNASGYLYSPFNEIDIWDSKEYPNGSGPVFNDNSFGNINAQMDNLPTTNEFVFTNNFEDAYNIPLTLVVNGRIESYYDQNGCEYRFDHFYYNWGIDFVVNTNFSAPPDSLLPSYITDTTTIVPDPLSIKQTNRDTYQLYPNPTDGIITLSSFQNNLTNQNISVNNLLGEKVSYSIFKSSINSVTLDMSYAPNGIYFIKFLNEDLHESIMFVKQ